MILNFSFSAFCALFGLQRHSSQPNPPGYRFRASLCRAGTGAVKPNKSVIGQDSIA
jgi:hypothetical protein